MQTSLDPRPSRPHTRDLEITTLEGVDPETILPEQWRRMCRSDQTTPERKLLLAVLLDALHAVGHGPGRVITNQMGRHVRAAIRAQQRRYEEAWGWVASDREDESCTFLMVCGALELEPQAVRQMLRDPETLRRLSGKERLRSRYSGRPAIRLHRPRRRRPRGVPVVGGVGADQVVTLAACPSDES